MELSDLNWLRETKTESIGSVITDAFQIKIIGKADETKRPDKTEQNKIHTTKT